VTELAAREAIVPSANDAGIDVLSDVLRAVRLSGALFFLTDASTPWTASVPAASELTPVLNPRAQHLISYHVVTSGSCWCESTGTSPLFLDEGDVVVLPHGDAYSLSHPVGCPGEWTPHGILDFFRSMAAPDHPFVVTEGGNGPGRVQVLCGFLGCDVRPFNPVFGTLPSVLRVPRAEGDHLSHLVDFTMQESRTRSAGADIVLIRLAELMFVEVVRRYIAGLAPEQTGWLAGLRDPVVGQALSLLHGQPQRAWSLQSLAHEVNQSRSVLAERFTHVVGTPPMQYLGRWRMQLAARLLADGNAKVAAVAAAVGYESEPAFSRAFTRATGMPPSAWRRSATRRA
jgi:AraC-like DNA-binding protein